MKRLLWLTVAYFAVLCAIAGSAPAAEFKAGEMEIYPTFNAAGIEIPYTGDDEGRVTGEMAWREAGDAEWRNGVDMTVDREKRFFWASIWPLEEATPIEVKVVFNDAGGAEVAVIDGAATTRRMILDGSGAVYHVAPGGDDANPGTKDKPFATIAKAAAVVKAGDTVYAATGVYREGGLLSGLKGEEGKPIVFAAAEGAAPVIDGSAEIAEGDGGWRELEGGTFVRDFEPETGYAGYAAQDGYRMFLYRDLEEFKGDIYGAKRAWHYDADGRKLHVRTGDGSSPSEHTYNIALHEWGANLGGSSNVVLRGFEIRYFGAGGVFLSDGSRGCVVLGNSIHNVPAGVFLKGEATRDNAIWRNEIYEKGLVDFSWEAIKASEYARQGVTGYAGRGTSVCHNTIHGFFDGIAPVSWKHPDELIWNRDFDIMFNEIRNTGDDAIEIDGGGVNMRIHGNAMRNVFAAISLAPVERGPLYCTRNHATYYMLMFKLNVGGCTSLGWAYSYHNSGYSLIDSLNARMYGGIAISLPPRRTIPITNKVFKNNAFISNIYGVRCASPGTYFDANCYWHVPGDRPLVFTREVEGEDGEWATVSHPSIEEFREVTGHERHGLYADPQFSATQGLGGVVWSNYIPTPFSAHPQVGDMSEGDLRLKGTSPCIDAGVVIRGINEDFAGKAPDIGAFEAR